MKLKRILRVENLLHAIQHWEGYIRYYKRKGYHNHLKAQRDFLKLYIKPWIQGTVNDTIAQRNLDAVKLENVKHKYFKNKKYIELVFSIDTRKYFYDDYEDDFKNLYFKLADLFWKKELNLIYEARQHIATVTKGYIHERIKTKLEE